MFKPSMGGGRGLRLRKQLKHFFFLSLFARCSGEKCLIRIMGFVSAPSDS